jgi:hypothetical protein
MELDNDAGKQPLSNALIAGMLMQLPIIKGSSNGSFAGRQLNLDLLVAEIKKDKYLEINLKMNSDGKTLTVGTLKTTYYNEYWEENVELVKTYWVERVGTRLFNYHYE